MDEGDVHAREAYQIVTSAYPFRDLAEETFQEIVRELDGNHLLWLDEASDTLEKSGGTWQYFYANLSMIPDESTYEVYDMSSRRGIGTLDERFVVVNFAGPGETFIQRGEMWRITEVDEGGGARERHAPSPTPPARCPLVDRAGDSGPEARCGGGRADSRRGRRGARGGVDARGGRGRPRRAVPR